MHETYVIYRVTRIKIILMIYNLIKVISNGQERARMNEKGLENNCHKSSLYTAKYLRKILDCSNDFSFLFSSNHF